MKLGGFMFKKKNSMAIVMGLLLLVVLFACGRKGTLNPHSEPSISITSYGGIDALNVEYPEVFQQGIYWSAHVEDGSIDGFAFRVLEYDTSAPNNLGSPIPTPGWEALDNDGWIYHYKEDVEVNDFTPPLDSPEAANLRTIWSERVYAIINFPAKGEPETDDQGNTLYDEFGSIIYKPVASIFQVKCISEYGVESNIDSRVFYAQSATPKVQLVSDFEDKILGKGGLFQFEIVDPDDDIPGVNAIAQEFQFCFLKGIRDSIVTATDTTYTFIPSGDDYGMVLLDQDGLPTDYDNWEWISTKNEDDIEKKRIPLRDSQGNVLLDLKPNIPDLDEGVTVIPTPQDSDEATFIFMRVIDLSNIVSDVEHVRFYVYGNFSPETRLYIEDTFILGQNHFQPVPEPSVDRVIPSQYTSSGVRYSKRFWRDREHNYKVIGSNDIKFYFHWGYTGEFMGNNPWGQRKNEVFDSITGNDYNSEIIYYHLRLNGEPVYYPPISEVSPNYIEDEDGKRWLKVSKYDVAFTLMILSEISLTHSPESPGIYGTHVFEIRSEDLQGAVDKNPVNFEFTIDPMVNKENKNGILLVNSSSSNLAMVETSYHEIMQSLNVDYEMVNYDTIPFLGEQYFYQDKDKLSPTDLQDYKLVILNQDVEPHNNGNFHKEFTTLNLYLHTGGNVMVTGGLNLWDSHIKSYENGYFPFQEVFGIGNINGTTAENDINYVGNNPFVKPYLINATPEITAFPELALRLEPPFFSGTISIAQGLGAVAYFNNHFVSNAVSILYRYGSKTPGQDNFSPLEGTGAVNADGNDIDPLDGFEEVNDLPIALKYEKANGSKCYLFGFPLLYMEFDGVKSLYQEIWNDLD
jgi:hypothetical protein